MTQKQESLDPELDVLTTVRREAALSETDARSYLHKYRFTMDEVFRPVGCLSFGERSLLMLALLTVGGCNFLLLDEPVNPSISPRAPALSRPWRAMRALSWRFRTTVTLSPGSPPPSGRSAMAPSGIGGL